MPFLGYTTSRLGDIYAAMPCRAPPVAMVVKQLLATPIQAVLGLTVCSLCSSDAAVRIGASLDMIHLAIQRLHAQVERHELLPLPLGPAVNVLVGDYIMSTAFGLIARWGNAEILPVLGSTLIAVCESEARLLKASAELHPGASQAALMGAAAGAVGALLAEARAEDRELAEQFGVAVSQCHFALLRLDGALPPGRRTELLADARQAHRLANLYARRLQQRCDITEPMKLAAWLEVRVAGLGATVPQCHEEG